MSGSQHNPNGRQSQLGSGWNPAMQMQMANLLARSQQLTPAHLNDRGVTWHTPTPPPHMYLPAPSPPDPLQGLQAMKSAGGNSMFRHTATPPDMYRHTPTPPDKHMMRGTPSPGDVKGPPVDIYQHLGASRETRLRADDILSFARQGSLDLSLGSRANGATPPAPHPASPALSVRDAPTINSLIARAGAGAAPRRVDALLERLAPSPHSVIVHSRAANTPSPPSSNEDSADSCSAPPGSKRKRKPERTVRLPAAPPLVPPPAPPAPPAPAPTPPAPAPLPGTSPAAGTIENGDTIHAKRHGPSPPPPCAPPVPPCAPAPPASPPARPPAPAHSHHEPTIQEETSRRKTRSGSAETIADIAAMIASGADAAPAPPSSPPPHPAPPALSVDKLQSVLGGPEPAPPRPRTPPGEPQPDRTSPVSWSGAAAPRRGPGSLSEATNAPVASPSEAKPAEPEPQPPEPAAASFVEVENQLEMMFAGIEEPNEPDAAKDSPPASKRRKSNAARGRTEAQTRRKGPRKKPDAKPRKQKDASGTKEAKEYDSGSNASSGKSRGPYIQIRGGRGDGSPVSVCVMNASTGDEEEWTRRREARGAGAGGGGGATRRRGLHASTLGLRYDAATRDLTWLCAFCARPPHASGLGDLFGPYAVDTDLDEYRALDEATRRRAACTWSEEGGSGGAGGAGRAEAWLHADCAVWAPGVLAGGARVWGLARAVWGAAPARCRHCARAAAPLACSARACPARAHLPCAREHGWRLSEEDFRALCPAHASPPRSDL